MVDDQASDLGHVRRGSREKRATSILRERDVAVGTATFSGDESVLFHTNQRTDEWGGTLQRRIRFAVEVTSAVASAIGAGRTGIRISPGNSLNDIIEDDSDAIYDALIASLAPMGLAYLHLMESQGLRELTTRIRRNWPGTLVLNPFTEGRSTGPSELALLDSGMADLIAYGALFLANPDAPARLASGGPFNGVDPATRFGGDHRGYTDYPFLV